MKRFSKLAMLLILFSTALVSCTDDDKNDETPQPKIADLKLSDNKVKVEENKNAKPQPN